ncbi:hypothetical protein ABZU75_13840 [Streptosporangium sp. NPDC005286]|uniref:hypothetical protein n=1 Tax=Streptosporangium sp. NPDC005286 TaxID=3154463 RepID=UPI0033AA5A34
MEDSAEPVSSAYVQVDDSGWIDDRIRDGTSWSRPVQGLMGPVGVWSTDFSVGRLDRAGAYRVGIYSDTPDCECFVAIGPSKEFWPRHP